MDGNSLATHGDLAAVNGGRSLTLSEPQFPHSLVEEWTCDPFHLCPSTRL